jgi:hypothetical protein
MIYIGIDNSYTGAIAAIECDGTGSKKIAYCSVMPTTSVAKNTYIDEEAVSNTLREITVNANGNVMVGFEIGQKNPLFGTKGNFSNGYSYGVIKTVIRLSKLPHIEVNPRTWQKEMFKDIKGAEMSTKDASFEFCRRTFPDQSLLATPRCKKPHDGMADAICIAFYLSKQ